MDKIRNLDIIRSEIDGVDSELARLMEKRMDLVCEVSDYKKTTGMKILDSSREETVLSNALKHVVNTDYHPGIRQIFEYMMNVSKDFQRKRINRPVKSEPKRFGLVGEKLSHSYSPKIHDLVFKSLKLPDTYELIEVKKENIPTIISSVKESGYSGVNVTVPYKSDIIKYLDELSPEAERIGAVNTITVSDRCVGYNTDYQGFGMALNYYGVNPEGKRCAVLGSGGSAHAVVACLEDQGASEIAIVSRDPDSAIFKFPGLSAVDINTFEAEGYNIIINTTPVGMFPETDASPLAMERLKGAEFVLDLIYNPMETKLLSYCSRLGIRCGNGLYMLVAQALYAESLWQGKNFDMDFINNIYEELKKNL